MTHMSECRRRSFRRRLPVGLVVAALVAAASPALAQTLALPPGPETTLSLGAVANYSEGQFGTGRTTQILYVPTFFQWFPAERWELRLTVPYLWERGKNIIAMVGGGPGQALRPVATESGLGASSRRRTEQGLGDILLEGDYTVLEARGPRPEIDVFAEIKFPTADDRTGLGTGEFDETLGVTFEKTLVERWTALLELSYTFVGSPAGTHLSDAAEWLLGLSYRPRRPLAISGYVNGATTVNTRQDNPLELRLQADYALGKIVKITGSITKGLSNASPRWGMTLGIVLEF